MSKSRKKILVTGGAGFVGTNLINFFLKKTKFNIISLDNYSSGTKKNHIKNNRVTYINGHTKNIMNLIKDPKNIHSIFHFGEFARIYQSFLKMNECVNSNFIGSNAVFNFCLKKNIVVKYRVAPLCFRGAMCDHMHDNHIGAGVNIEVAVDVDSTLTLRPL